MVELNNLTHPVDTPDTILNVNNTYTLEQTLPPSMRTKLVWTSLSTLALAFNFYGIITLSTDSNSDVFGRIPNGQFSQGAILMSATILDYFHVWNKMRRLRSQHPKTVAMWVVGFFLHLVITIYYILAKLLSRVPIPPVAVDYVLLIHPFITLLIGIWLA